MCASRLLELVLQCTGRQDPHLAARHIATSIADEPTTPSSRARSRLTLTSLADDA